MPMVPATWNAISGGMLSPSHSCVASQAGMRRVLRRKSAHRAKPKWVSRVASRTADPTSLTQIQLCTSHTASIAVTENRPTAMLSRCRKT